MSLSLSYAGMIKLTSKGNCEDFAYGMHSAWHVVATQ